MSEEKSPPDRRSADGSVEYRGLLFTKEEWQLVLNFAEEFKMPINVAIENVISTTHAEVSPC